MIKWIFISLLIFNMLGCAPKVKPTYFDGSSITYQHGWGMFEDAMDDAVNQCLTKGKKVKHERTDCPDRPARCISTFSCVD